MSIEIRNISKRFGNFVALDNINLDKNVKLVNGPAGKTLELNYEVRKPLLYNLDFVAKFERSFPVSGQPGVE